MSVIAFRKPPQKPTEPWCQGEAKCLNCQHTWEAAAPVGTRFLECPECETCRGVWYRPAGATEGDELFYCRLCDGEALTAFKRGGLFYLMCMGCGVDHTDAIFGG